MSGGMRAGKRQEVSGGQMRTEIVRCTRHGQFPFCWVQSDGEHINDSRCRCLSDSPVSCPVDVHREDAEPYLDFSNKLKKGVKR